MGSSSSSATAVAFPRFLLSGRAAGGSGSARPGCAARRPRAALPVRRSPGSSRESPVECPCGGGAISRSSAGAHTRDRLPRSTKPNPGALLADAPPMLLGAPPMLTRSVRSRATRCSRAGSVPLGGERLTCKRRLPHGVFVARKPGHVYGRRGAETGKHAAVVNGTARGRRALRGDALTYSGRRYKAQSYGQRSPGTGVVHAGSGEGEDQRDTVPVYEHVVLAASLARSLILSQAHSENTVSATRASCGRRTISTWFP